MGGPEPDPSRSFLAPSPVRGGYRGNGRGGLFFLKGTAHD